MFNHEFVRDALTASLTDARYWRDKGLPDPERALFWAEHVQIYSLALATLEAVLDRHEGITCHPDADCDHEEPSFGLILARIPTTAQWLTSLRTTKRHLAELVAEKLLWEIGKTAELDRWARENGE
jgi:hypothetical protein